MTRFSILAALILFAILVYGYSVQYYLWNGGVCRRSGRRWRAFDRDSSGATGYTDGENNYLWCSWPVDRWRR